MFKKYAKFVALALMFGMLIISFAFWGIGDMVRGGPSDPVVAEVGDTQIRGREVRERFNTLLDEVQSRGGTRLTSEQAVAVGLHLRALEESVQRALLDRAIVEYGIVISDEQVRAEIAANPGFAGADGKFDRAIYAAIVQRRWRSEAAFLAELRRDIAVAQLLSGVQGGVAVPSALRDTLFRLRREQRIGETLLIPFETFRDVPQPTPEQIKTHYDANAERFRLPEYRALSYVTVSIDDVAAEVAVGEQQARRAYEERIGDFTRPEKRDIDQVVIPDEAVAARIAAAAKAGKPLEDAAAEALGRPGTAIKLGPTERKDLPAPLAEPVFALAEGAVSEPIRSPFGWHVVRVNRVEPGAVDSFETARPRIEAELKKELAPELLVKLVADFDRALGRAENLAAAAKGFNLRVTSVDSADARGRTPGGAPAISGPLAAELLRTAFGLKEGEQSSVIDAPTGESYVVRVDRIVASRVPPLDEIQARVAFAWQEAERRRLAEARAREIVERLSPVAELAAQARALRLETRVAKPVTRVEQDAANNLPPSLVEELFKLQPGGAAHATLPSGVAIVRLREIVAADPAKSPDDAKRLAAELERAMGNDILDQFLGGLRLRYGVKPNAAAFAQLFRSEQ